MSTGNEQSWLAARGFKPGMGGLDSISVGWNGDHTAATFMGMPVQSTTSHGISGVRVGGPAAGADSSQFPNHMHLDVSAMGVGSGSEGADPVKLRNKEEQITNLEKHIGVLEQKQKEFAGKTKESERKSVENQLEADKQKLADAKSDLTDLQNKPLSFAKGGRGEKGGFAALFGAGEGGKGGGDNPISELFNIFKGGARETLQVPGFTNYMQSPLAKSAGAALTFFGGLLGGGGGRGGGGGLGELLAHPIRAALGHG
jgi:hypothetical protein